MKTSEYRHTGEVNCSKNRRMIFERPLIVCLLSYVTMLRYQVCAKNSCFISVLNYPYTAFSVNY